MFLKNFFAAADSSPKTKPPSVPQAVGGYSFGVTILSVWTMLAVGVISTAVGTFIGTVAAFYFCKRRRK